MKPFYVNNGKPHQQYVTGRIDINEFYQPNGFRDKKKKKKKKKNLDLIYEKQICSDFYKKHYRLSLLFCRTNI